MTKGTPAWCRHFADAGYGDNLRLLALCLEEQRRLRKLLRAGRRGTEPANRIDSLRMLSRVWLALVCAAGGFAQDNTVVVRPVEIDDVLVNPGIGFMTFQRFNGDALNQGTKWTEGYPIEYQPFTGSLENKNHPLTSIAYFRVYWKFIEPEEGRFRWDLIDTAMRTAHDRKQTLMLRIAPYGTEKNNDVPEWYRKVTGEDPNRKLPDAKWRVDPENPAYARYFGRMVRALGERYDGHPDLELVDISIVAAWGEGSGSDLLSQPVREALSDAYVEAFKKTPLVIQPTDAKTVAYTQSKAPVGWRVDCLGDMGGFSDKWCHMLDLYPQDTIRFGLQDAWKTRPVTHGSLLGDAALEGQALGRGLHHRPVAQVAHFIVQREIVSRPGGLAAAGEPLAE